MCPLGASGPHVVCAHNVFTMCPLGIWALVPSVERPGGAFNWLESHNSPFELTKLTLVNFSPRGSSNLPLTINHVRMCRMTTIRATNAYRFLSVIFDPRLKWKAQHEKAARSAATWINLVKRLMHTALGISAGGMRQLYLSVAIPKITYAVEVWYTLPHKAKPANLKRTGSVTFTNKVQSAQRRAAITMMGAMGTTAGDILNAHAFIPPPHLLFLKALTRSATRLVTLPSQHPMHGPTRHCLR